MDGEEMGRWMKRGELGEATHGDTSFLQQGAVAANNYLLPGRNLGRSEAGSTDRSRRTGISRPHTVPCALKQA